MKNILWFILFFAFVWAGDRLGGYVLDNLTSGSQFRYSRLYNGKAPADILLLGNSRGLTFYQPYIEEITGGNTLNLSYNGMPMDLLKVLTQDHLDRYPAPKVALIDITTCDRRNKELIYGFLPYIKYSTRLDTLIRAQGSNDWYGSKVSHLYRYNNEVFQRAMYYRNTSDEDWLLDRVISAEQAAAVDKNSYDLQIDPFLMHELKATVESLQAKGVKVHLVISPYLPGFAKNVSNLTALKLVAEAETGLLVKDYSRALTDNNSFGDFMHPNIKGAKEYIDKMRADGLF